jgi:phosphoglucomutase
VAKIAATAGVGKLIIGEDGLLSAPAASNLVRKRNTAGAIYDIGDDHRSMRTSHQNQFSHGSHSEK